MDMLRKRTILFFSTVLVVLAVVAGITAWTKLHNDVRQPKWWITDPKAPPDKLREFLYGSVGAEGEAGMPYWIWLVLPRMFHEYVTEPGGYAGLGRPWEEGMEMPAGFSKKTVGYVRVAGNCALCHAVSRPGPSGAPVVAVGGPGQTTDIQPLLSFFTKCAQDPRFNSDEILAQIDQVTKLSVVDHLLYRFVLIPQTRQAFRNGPVLLDAELRDHPHAAFTDEQLQALGTTLKELRAQATGARPSP
jgi:hypothetical protein